MKVSLLVVLALLIDVALVLALEWEVVGLGAALVEGDQEVGAEIAVAKRKTSILHFLVCGGHGGLVFVRCCVEWRVSRVGVEMISEVQVKLRVANETSPR